MTFAENLNRLCVERGTNMTTLSLQCGKSKSWVTAVKRGLVPKEDLLARLAEVLQCSVSEFFMSDVEIEKAKSEPDALNEDETDIIRVFRQLSNKEKHKVMAQVYHVEDSMLHQEV